MKGFSPRNLKYMKRFAKEWPDKKIVQRTVAQTPWRSNITLLEKLGNSEMRLWYAEKVLELGLGKDMLVHQIDTKLHLRIGSSVNNFKKAIPPTDSDLTAQVFKDPYIFDFLGTADPRLEAELEQKLIDHIQKFLLELGQEWKFRRDNLVFVKGQARYYSFGGYNFSTWSLQAGVGVPLPW